MVGTRADKSIQITEGGPALLDRFSSIPSNFWVKSCYQVKRGMGGEFTLVSNTVSPAYVKDYDSKNGRGLLSCQKRWNLDNWGFFSANIGNECVGSAVIAFDTEGIEMLENRKDLAVLWDLRVRSDYRKQKIGSLLFEAVCIWSVKRKCIALKIETQNTNVPACNFYKKQNCELRNVNTGIYPDYMDDLQMFWYRNLV